MPRSVLLTEGDSALGGALARLLAARGCSVMVAVERRSGGDAGEPPAPGPDDRPAGAVPWNRRSPISARSVMLAALNCLQTVDEVMILEPPCPVRSLLQETASADIERALDNAKGPIFLAREALSYFQRRDAGVLCMVGGGPAAGPLESGVRECFRGFVTSLLAGAGRKGILINGFQSGEVGAEEYAAFIDRTLEEKARTISGRWFTCQPRGGFFQGVLSAPSRKG